MPAPRSADRVVCRHVAASRSWRGGGNRATTSQSRKIDALIKVRVQLLGELDALVQDLPEDLRVQLRPSKTVSARVNSLGHLDTSGVTDPTVARAGGIASVEAH